MCPGRFQIQCFKRLAFQPSLHTPVGTQPVKNQMIRRIFLRERRDAADGKTLQHFKTADRLTPVPEDHKGFQRFRPVLPDQVMLRLISPVISAAGNDLRTGRIRRHLLSFKFHFLYAAVLTHGLPAGIRTGVNVPLQFQLDQGIDLLMFLTPFHWFHSFRQKHQLHQMLFFLQEIQCLHIPQHIAFQSFYSHFRTSSNSPDNISFMRFFCRIHTRPSAPAAPEPSFTL